MFAITAPIFVGQFFAVGVAIKSPETAPHFARLDGGFFRRGVWRFAVITLQRVQPPNHGANERAENRTEGEQRYCENYSPNSHAIILTRMSYCGQKLVRYMLAQYKLPLERRIATAASDNGEAVRVSPGQNNPRKIFILV